MKEYFKPVAGAVAIVAVTLLVNIAVLLGVIALVVWFLRYLGVLPPA